jgi:hypothetical protein
MLGAGTMEPGHGPRAVAHWAMALAHWGVRAAAPGALQDGFRALEIAPGALPCHGAGMCAHPPGGSNLRD